MDLAQGPDAPALSPAQPDVAEARTPEPAAVAALPQQERDGFHAMNASVNGHLARVEAGSDIPPTLPGVVRAQADVHASLGLEAADELPRGPCAPRRRGRAGRAVAGPARRRARRHRLALGLGARAGRHGQGHLRRRRRRRRNGQRARRRRRGRADGHDRVCRQRRRQPKRGAQYRACADAGRTSPSRATPRAATTTGTPKATSRRPSRPSCSRLREPGLDEAGARSGGVCARRMRAAGARRAARPVVARPAHARRRLSRVLQRGQRGPGQACRGDRHRGAPRPVRAVPHRRPVASSTRSAPASRRRTGRTSQPSTDGRLPSRRSPARASSATRCGQTCNSRPPSGRAAAGRGAHRR